MPTTHYASRQFLEQKGLDIDWRIDITSQKKKRKINGDIPLNLKRVSDEVIWVRDGGEHPVYILQAEDGASDDTDDDMVWVLWLSNGKKECIYNSQIIVDGLRGRKRQRANFYAEDKDKDMDVLEHNKKNKSKKIKKTVSPVRVSKYLSPQYQAEKQAEDLAVKDQDVNVSENNKKNKSEKLKSSEDIAPAEEVEEDDVPTTDHKVSDETCPVDGKTVQVSKRGLYSRDGFTQKEFNANMQQLQMSQSSNPKQQQCSMQPQYQQTQPQYIDRVSQPYAQEGLISCNTLQHSSMMLQCGMQLVANAINRHKAEFYNLLKAKRNGVTEMEETRKRNLAVAMKAANAIMLPEQVVLSQLIKAEQEATDLCIFTLQKEKKDGFIGTNLDVNHRSSEYLCLPPKQSSAQRRQGKQPKGTGKDQVEEANKRRDS